MRVEDARDHEDRGEPSGADSAGVEGARDTNGENEHEGDRSRPALACPPYPKPQLAAGM